ncbi:opioid growth factor receptor conserved region-domain-containing protein [Mrakia frigida]|uniref:opioid growth factor receptor conserved region-domain-containing protein n=1 Tax=Mrakia frigida TaxID=29902 RepID=UPI003FCC2495
MLLPPDVQQFQSMYPRLNPNPTNSKNLEFYTGKGKALPGSLKIDELLDRLENDWAEVESNHGFIQWLFPIPEHGMNWQSQPLEPHEAQAISSDPLAMERLMRSYEMMLAFYGIRMIDRNRGILGRADNFKARFAHLLSHSHNLLRITRILKSLTILSPPPSSPNSTHTMPSLLHHPSSLILFLLAQHNDLRLNLLPGTTAGGSLERFWSGCLRVHEEREWVGDLIEGRKKRVGKEGKLVGRVQWGEEEYYEWVKARFGGAEEEEEELDIVEEVLSGKEEETPSDGGCYGGDDAGGGKERDGGEEVASQFRSRAKTRFT